MVLCSLFAALIAICAWLSIPVPPVAFTMQTFGILLTLGVLGGKWGTAAILLYLLLGTVGLPVFTGFRGGAGALLDASGGFLWGFLLAGGCYWALERFGKFPAMAAGQLVCYVCGCFWFTVYTPGASVWAAAAACVAPYMIPDGIKLWLALSLSRRMEKHLKY